MKAPRWIAVSQSAFPWEREALEFARTNLPDHEPWRAWSNFEFIDDEGRVNEVDLLVLTPAGLVLVEIKSRPGTVKGDAQTWTWTTDGRNYITDNPLPLANRKAKRLATVLRRQEALAGKGGYRSAAPWVEPLIWLSHVKELPRIDQGSAMRVAIAGKAGDVDGPGMIGILSRAEELGFGRRGTIDTTAVRTITRAIEQAGIRAPSRGRRVGDYELEKLLTEGETWQDFAARHVATGVARRIRIYPFARAATSDAREKLVRMAQREFRVLEGVEHPGIQRVLDYREAEMGPALVFEHDPASVRLDRYLVEHNQNLPLTARLGLVRQLAEAMAFAHSKRLFHRGLAPQNILVRNPESDIPRLQIANWEVARREEGSQSGNPMTAGTRDLKPDNIGIAKSPSSGAYRLVLFDFSLSRAPAENIQAGTRPYLDPFLVDRRPPRWDLHAERYAAAVTLHEMLTGAAPVFGDGLSEPSMIEDEATVAVERFDPALRGGLHAFFERALRRDASARFASSTAAGLTTPRLSSAWPSAISFLNAVRCAAQTSWEASP